MFFQLNRLLSIAAVLLATACAFSPGEPWGAASFVLQAQIVPGAERVLPDGKLATAAGYALTLDHAELSWAGLGLQMAAAAGGSFDPAKPPVGYSLCHHGHCHATDGRLVDYAEIEAQLATAQGKAPPGLDLAAPATVSIGLAVGPVFAANCAPAGCDLPRGELRHFRWRTQALRLRGRVYATPTAVGSLPAGGRAFDLTVPLAAISHPLAGRADNGEPVAVRVAARLQIGVSLFDGTDFSALPHSGDTIESAAFGGQLGAIAERLISAVVLQVSVTRD